MIEPLSVISLTFQVFSGCIEGYQLITEARHMPEECQYLRVRLKTEQYRLLDWAEVVNLDEQDDKLLISKASKGPLLDVLDQQQKLLQYFGRLDDKYRPLSKPLLVELGDPPQYSEIPSPSMKRVDSEFQIRFPSSEALLKKSLHWVRSTRSAPRRLKWAIFDKAKMEALVLKLTSFNDFMREMLNTTQLHDLSIKQTRTEFQIMQLNGRMDQLIQIFKSAALKSSQPVRPSHYRDRDDSEESFHNAHGLAGLAQFKAFTSAIEDSTFLTGSFTQDLGLNSTDIQSIEISRAWITLPDDDEETQRVEAEYTDPRIGSAKKVWVEWKTYEPPTFQDSGPEDKIHERVKALAALLKENNRTNQIRAPHCLGYFRDIDEHGEDHCRFGLVFEKPQGVSSSTPPISLLELLKKHKEQDVPSLTARVQLAFRITECIERLHAVNWLHKGLRSANILFFSDGSVDITSPYLTGFDYSRPAQNDDMTERPPENAATDIYRHPKVQGNNQSGGFRKSYDLYALGVILLEIAYWKPIDSILGIPNLHTARPSVTIKVRSRLIDDKEEFLRFVRSYLGDTMEGVVKACLLGPSAFGIEDKADEKDEEVGAQLQRMFYERVVKQLESMRV